MGAADRLWARVYDLTAAALFLPLGGLDRMREQALDAITVAPGMRVLELGCGTGGITRKLVMRGARMTAVDRSRAALRLAARRAPGAETVRAELDGFTAPAAYDRVLLAFVLHEIGAAGIARILGAARNALAPGGRAAVLDWADPPGGLPRRLVRGFVRAGEPESAGAWLSTDVGDTMRSAGLAPVDERVLARGAARLVIAAAAG
ncbi:MAG TPA: class I SAM-dependent methyltransferase [Longimicrobium sp.]|nr:class I SAM-dependent methyltransferase [Longimicrobium sp.]